MGGWDETSPEEMEKRKQEALAMIRGTLDMAAQFKTVMEEFAKEGDIDGGLGDLFDNFPELDKLSTTLETMEIKNEQELVKEQETVTEPEPAMTQQQVMELLKKGKGKKK
jgi:hypothetical protein